MKYEQEGNAINGAVVALAIEIVVILLGWMSAWCYHQAIGK